MLELIGAWPKSTAISWIEKYMYAYLETFWSAEFLLAIVRYTLLIFHEKDIHNDIEHIEKDWINTWHYSDRIIMIRNAKFGLRRCRFFSLARTFSVGKITEDHRNLTYRPLV